MLNQFSNLSCYEEFEIQSALTGISKIDILKVIGHKIDDYYFFISEDGIFNWFDLNGNYVEDPGVLKEIKKDYISKNITKCVIPDSVIRLDDDAFVCYKSLKEIIIPNSVTSIGYGAFGFCESLTSIIIPNSVTRIGYGTFYKCKSLMSIIIPDSVIYIDIDAFNDCESLKEIIIPDSVTSIGDCAFSRCYSLKLITIPNSVTSIGTYAFHNCKSLKEVIFKGKTLEEVKQMDNYPWDIEDESIIKCV